MLLSTFQTSKLRSTSLTRLAAPSGGASGRAIRRRLPPLFAVTHPTSCASDWNRVSDTLALSQPQGRWSAVSALRHAATPSRDGPPAQQDGCERRRDPGPSSCEQAGTGRRASKALPHAVRHLVGVRAQLKGMSVDLSNQIRSILKTFGLMAGKGAGHKFALRVQELLEGGPRFRHH